MSDTEIRIYRGRVYEDGVDKGRVRRIGSGMFAVAYETLDTTTPRVLLVVQEDDSGDYSKSALSEITRDGESNIFLPKVTRAGWLGDTPVYEMPLYRSPLRKSDSPKAWAQYRVLKKCWDGAEEAMREHFGWKNASSPYNGHWQMNYVIDCAKKDKNITRALLTALETLRNYMANYGSEYSFEFSPRNLATNDRGRLILLDTTFSRLSVQRQRTAAYRKHRGW